MTEVFLAILFRVNDGIYLMRYSTNWSLEAEEMGLFWFRPFWFAVKTKVSLTSKVSCGWERATPPLCGKDSPD
jgi:hypothetical protein